jgi:hypothetical protein
MIGRRPYAAFGNWTGDRQMLEWTAAGGGAPLKMLVLHDDAAREYAYGPAARLPDTKVSTFTPALYDEAKKKGWTVISMKDGWKAYSRSSSSDADDVTPLQVKAYERTSNAGRTTADWHSAAPTASITPAVKALASAPLQVFNPRWVRKSRISDQAGSASRSCTLVSSDTLKNLRASHPDHAAIRGNVCRDPSCGNRRGADKAPGPGRGYPAIGRPSPRRLECDPRGSNASDQIVGNSRTWARRGIDENSGEISSCRVSPQNLQERAPLTLPNGRYQALGRRRSGGCDEKKQSGDDTVHIHSPSW